MSNPPRQGKKPHDLVFVRKLIELRTGAGKTQYDVAAGIKIRQSRISDWENEKGYPEPRILVAMARYFGVPLEYLCDPSITELPDPKAAHQSEVPPEYHTVLDVARRLGVDKAMARLIG